MDKTIDKLASRLTTQERMIAELRTFTHECLSEIFTAVKKNR